MPPHLESLGEALPATILQTGRHSNKLRMGHNRGNRFTCALHGTTASDAAIIARRDADATMVVMPADHVIRDVEAFHSTIRRATELVAFAMQGIQFAAEFAALRLGFDPTGAGLGQLCAG